MSERKPFIVGIGGTTREGSSSEQALAMALAYAATQGADTKLYGGMALQLPMYDPDPGMMTDAARGFIEDLRRADGVIIASPCYHGGVSGLVKVVHQGVLTTRVLLPTEPGEARVAPLRALVQDAEHTVMGQQEIAPRILEPVRRACGLAGRKAVARLALPVPRFV